MVHQYTRVLTFHLSNTFKSTATSVWLWITIILLLLKPYIAFRILSCLNVNYVYWKNMQLERLLHPYLESCPYICMCKCPFQALTPSESTSSMGPSVFQCLLTDLCVTD